MLALLHRNIKIYFANIPGVIMSCLGALISFFIYIGFLQSSLKNSWGYLPDATKMLDLWMIAGIVAIAGITTSFQALGQLVKDRESRTTDDLRLTDISSPAQNLAYVLSGTVVSFIMQVVTFIVMVVYFTAVDKIKIASDVYLPMLAFIISGAVTATLLNAVIVLFVHTSTTFSRLSAVVGAAAGFAVATYMPYGTLSAHIQTLVKLVPSSYEASALRSLLLNQISKSWSSSGMREQVADYLGIHFKIHGYQLTRIDSIYMMVGMAVVLAVIIIFLSVMADRKRNG